MLALPATTFYFIGTHRICCDDKNKTLIIDSHISIRFSSIQYKLLKPLVESRQVPVSDAVLVKVAYASDHWQEMHDNLDKHFDHIRNKLRPHGLNAYRVGGYGYVLLAIPDQDNDP